MTVKQKPSEMQNIKWKGGKYTGQLKDNVPHGSGRLLLPDGTKYEGEWDEGVPHGRGKLIYANGDVYKGFFLKGKRHGYGINIQADGKKRSGLWQNGKLVKPMSLEEMKKKMRDKTVPEKYKQGSKVSQVEPAINVQKLSHRYGNLQAVKGINFSVRPGEILGFLGPNGAGKSTTIKVLTGQLALQNGFAQILGRDIGRDDPILQSKIGVTFEEKNLYLEMSALENLDFFASLFGIRKPDSMGALRRVGLADRAGDRVGNYSKGMRQRLMIARAFINKPQVLFLDEPTDGLDPVTAVEIRKTIQEEAKRGAAVLLTTHNMHEADELSDRVAFINEGEIAALDTVENLKLKYGKRSVRVRLREGDEVVEENLPLDGGKSSARLSELAASPNLLTIHTEEATLEAIFIKLTGRRLAG
ncbi:MAG: ATP-binding cassette domain-containing protein [Bacillota bacterium]